MQKLYSQFALLAALFCFALVPGLHAQTCTITSPTASQLIQAVQPVQLTATISSAPTAYSLEYDIDYRRWRKAYLTNQNPSITDFGDNYQGAWVATWYSGLYGDGPHVISGVLRDIFGTTLATCPTVSFTVRVEGMSNQAINLIPNQSGNNTSGTGALGLLTFDQSNNGNRPLVDGRSFGSDCGMTGATSQTGGSQIPSFNTTCGVTNGLHLISYFYSLGNIADPYVLSKTISSVSGTSINFGTCNSPRGATDPGCHYSVQTTATNPDVVTFATTGTQYTGVNNGSQWYWAAGGTGTVTQSVAGSTLVLTTSAAHGASSGTPIFVRNLGYADQGGAGQVCDGLYAAASGTSGTTINLALSSSPSGCPNGTVTSITGGSSVTTLVLSGTLPSAGNIVTISGYTGAACTGGSTANSWTCLNGTFGLTPVGSSTYTISAALVGNTAGLGPATGAGIFAPFFSSTGDAHHLSDLEVDVNPYFANYVDASHISVSASPSGSSPISLSGSCTGSCTVSQLTRSPYWTGTNSGGNVKLGTDFAASGGPAVVTIRPNFANGSSPMEIRPPSWEYHGWPGKTGDTLAAIIENTDLTSTPCSASCTYSVTADGTVTGAISVNASTGAITYAPASSWSNPSAPTTWAQFTVTTTASVGVTTYTGYIEEDPGLAPVFPHYTTCGGVVTTFVPGTPGTCHSFFPTGIQDTFAVTGWEGPGVFTNGHFNAMEGGMSGGSNQNLINPTATSCPSYPDTVMTTNENFAGLYGVKLVYDIYDVWFNRGQGVGGSPLGGGLAPILNNVGYNRRACLTTFVNYMVSTGKYFGFKNDDETTFQTGTILRMNPTIQASINSTWGNGWTSAAVSGTGITFNVVNPQSLPGNWSQSAGTGAWIQVVNATNSCLNGWYPILTSNSTQWTSNNNGSCANGTYEPSGGTTETTAQVTVNQSPLGCFYNGQAGCTGLNNQQNVTVLPSNLSALGQVWDTNLTSIVVSSCVATVHWTGHSIPGGTAIRIWTATTANLNIVAPIGASPPMNTFTITYPNVGTGEACPANGTYNASTDANLAITVDPNWGAPNNGDPVGAFFSIINAVTGAPSTVMSIQGGNFGNPPTVYSYDGNPNNVGGAFVYNGGSPSPYLGDAAGVWSNINFDTLSNGNSGGLATRAFQLKPRGVLWGWGVVNGGYSIQTTCRSFTFNPGCDQPAQLSWRPEEIIAQIMGGKSHDYSRISGYNLMYDTPTGYLDFCCGWQASGGTGTGGGLNPYIAPKAFKAGALANALLTLRTETELQPEANKPYFGPYFTTDAHFSATYGNELQIVCGSESPYGSFPVTLPQISGGTTLKYVLTGYSLSMTVMGGNPATDTDEFCATPGRTTTYVALPASPALNPVDHITFAAPSAVPSGTSKFLIQVGYYAPDLSDDPVTDCTSGCTIAVDHHDMDAYYRTIYADSNSIPKITGGAITIKSQGLF